MSILFPLRLNLPPAPPASPSIKRAVLEALTYSDIFDFPLRLDELHRYLPVRAEVRQVQAALASLRGRVDSMDEYYFIAGRAEIVQIRKQRTERSRKLLPHALKYGRVLGSLPFVRMVALTGSLAVMNVSEDADFDYMLVAAQGRVWTARLFALALNRAANGFGHTLCPNLIISESALEWTLHDLYSARELCQMLPLTGLEVYRKLMQSNRWVREFLPNAWMDSGGLPPKTQKQISALQRFLEPPLRGTPGDRFEAWEMNRKVARFSKQKGFGEETVFTPQICQGNFHHHRRWTMNKFAAKLMESGAE